MGASTLAEFVLIGLGREIVGMSLLMICFCFDQRNVVTAV